MGSLNSLWLSEEKLKTLLDTVQRKKEKGVELTVSINDETNQWGQNVSAYVSQTKEQREAKKDRFYVGNGKCFWTDGTIKVATKPEENQGDAATSSSDEEDDLPF